MTFFWQMGPSIQAMERFYSLADETPPGIEWLERPEMKTAADALAARYDPLDYWNMNAIEFNNLPLPGLRISASTFDVNILLYGALMIASLKLQIAFDLDQHVVQYRPIDMRPSVAEAQTLGYAAFNVVPYGNPFDPQKSPGKAQLVCQNDGSTTTEWILDTEILTEHNAEVHFRSDFQPPAPLFRGTGTHWVFATDDLAERLLRAGIDDVLFQDITGPITRRNRDRKRIAPKH